MKVLEYFKKAPEDSWKALEDVGGRNDLLDIQRDGSLITFKMSRFGHSMCLDPERVVLKH